MTDPSTLRPEPITWTRRPDDTTDEGREGREGAYLEQRQPECSRFKRYP